MYTNSFNSLDIILYSSQNSYYRYFINLLTGKKWTHVAVIIHGKDINEIHSNFSKNIYHLDNNKLYIWESNIDNQLDSEDNICKKGIRIIPFEKHIFKNCKHKIRKLKKKLNIQQINKLKEIHLDVHSKLYDYNIIHWLELLLGFPFTNNDIQRDNSFVCSAFIGFLFTKLELLDSNTNWNLLKPDYFDSDNLNDILEI